MFIDLHTDNEQKTFSQIESTSLEKRVANFCKNYARARAKIVRGSERLESLFADDRHSISNMLDISFGS